MLSKYKQMYSIFLAQIKNKNTICVLRSQITFVSH